jgi:hypothetical protein
LAIGNVGTGPLQMRSHSAVGFVNVDRRRQFGGWRTKLGSGALGSETERNEDQQPRRRKESARTGHAQGPLRRLLAKRENTGSDIRQHPANSPRKANKPRRSSDLHIYRGL